MPLRGSTAVLVLVAVSAVVPAAAHAKRPGSHFLAEVDAGACLSGDAGPAASVAFGAGGKLKGFPARFYLLGRMGQSEYQATSSAAMSPWPGAERGSFSDFAIGPRVYVPLVGPLRWFVDGLFGATLASGTYVEQGLAPLSAEQWLALAVVSTGLQWRLLYELSISARVGVAFNEAGLIGVERVAGVHDTARTTLTGGLTWLF
jgi:hypothetical protein